MSSEMVMSIIRHLLTILGTWIMARGIFDAGTWESVSGAVLTLITVAWGVWQKTQSIPRHDAKILPLMGGGGST